MYEASSNIFFQLLVAIYFLHPVTNHFDKISPQDPFTKVLPKLLKLNIEFLFSYVRKLEFCEKLKINSFIYVGIATVTHEQG